MMVGATIRQGVTEETLKAIDPELHHGDIKPFTILLEGGVSLEEFRQLKGDVRRLYLDNPHEIRILLKVIPFSELKNLDHAFCEFLVEHAHTIYTLFRAGMSWEEFKNMNPKHRRQILGAV